MRKIREVRKRDNRVVPFDKTKIADAIYAAFRSVGEGDRSLAQELASAVIHFLEGKFAGTIPGIEDIQDVVETVLIEMGHTRAAKAYILYRQKRAMMRETLQVRKALSGESAVVDEDAEDWGDKERRLPEVDQGAEGASSWQKSKIAAALIREADLDPSVAQEVASNVERKVLNSGMQRLSTSLIRELVDNELFERGFSAKLQKQAPISLPKYNLEQIIFGTDAKEGFTFPKTPLEIRNIISSRILQEYSLQEVFTPNIANAHNDGRIFIHRLSDPMRLSRFRWHLPPPGISLARLDSSPDDFASPAYADVGDLSRSLSHLSHFFSEEIRISGLGNALMDPPTRAASTAERARAALERLSQMDERPDIALEFDLSPNALPWFDALSELARTRPRRFLLAIRVEPDIFRNTEGEAVLRRVAGLYGMGERIEFLPAVERVGEGEEGPAGLPRGTSVFRANAAKITINLPHAACRSGRDRRSSMETEIDEVLSLAVRGHLERRRFIEKLSASRESPLWDLLGWRGETPLISSEEMVFSVGLVGLNECVKYLTGSELHQDPVAAALGLDLVKEIDRKLRREERSLGIRLALQETANVGPLRLLERSDRRKYPQMAEIDRGRNPQWGLSYTHGVRLHRMAPVDPFRRVEELARYLRILESDGGFVEDFPELRSSSSDLLLSLLEECAPVVAGRPRAALITQATHRAETRKGREEKG